MTRALIELAKRRVREAREPYGSRMPDRALIQPTPDLRAWLHEVPFAICGGLATRLYMQERMTLDVDVLVAAEDEAAASALLETMGARSAGPLAIGGHTWRLPNGRMLDLIAWDRPWLDESLDKAVAGPDGQPYLDLPYLVLMKLEASRVQDLADLSRMLGGQDEGMLERVREAVRRYRPSDQDDLESLIVLGRAEIKV